MSADRLRKLWLPACALLLGAAACGERRPLELRLTGDTMGTQYSVAIVSDRRVDGDRLRRGIRGTLDTVESQMSTYIAESPISRFNDSAGTGWQR